MPVTRMSVAAMIRETLEKASRYEKQSALSKKKPDKYDEPEYDKKRNTIPFSCSYS